MLQALSDFISKVTRGETLTIAGEKARWKKVSELTPGMRIAVPRDTVTGHGDQLSEDMATSAPGSDVLWDEIISIKRLWPERVYDIEVEGTHNFVAGHMIESPVPKTAMHLSDEPLRGPPYQNQKSKFKSQKFETKRWYGGIFAHNTYISGNLGIGTTSPGSKLQVVGNITPSVTNTYDLGSSSLYWNNVYANNITSSGQYGGFWQRNSGVLSAVNITDDLLVGATATPSSSTANYFQILGSGSTSGDASSSGNLVLGTNRTAPTIATRSFKNLTLGDSATGNIVLSPGTGKQVQFFSSSNYVDSSGNLVLAGNLTVPGTTTFNGQAYTWPSGGQSSGYALTTNGSGALSWAAASGLGTNYWTLANGSLYPVNATVDLLVGGTATTSAKFAFINVAAGTPTASVSGNLTLDAAGVIATTKMQQLTLGSATTGPIQLSPKGTTGLFVDATGQVGIGTTGPGQLLDVRKNQAGYTYIAVDNANTPASGTGEGYAISEGGTIYHALRAERDNSGTLNLINGANGPINIQTGSTFAGATSKVTITTAGLVGIGTTAPIGKLHVEGQCVAVGTLIRRRRRKVKGKRQKAKVTGTGPNPDFEDVPVEDIEIGDEVLTLNEATGKFITQTVEDVMDKGTQQTFVLTTSSGKQILTTDQHPYYVIDRPAITPGTFEIDQSIRIEDMTAASVVAVAGALGAWAVTLSTAEKRKIKALYQGQRKPTVFAPQVFAKAIVATLRMAGIYPEHLVIDLEYPNSAYIINTEIAAFFPETMIQYQSIGRKSAAHLSAHGVHRKIRETTGILHSEIQNKKDRWHIAFRVVTPQDRSVKIRNPRGLFVSTPYHMLTHLSRAKWIKVKHIKKGHYVATVDGWEKVTNILPMKHLHTYDLAIANTHNFVANGIVAHNTTGKALLTLNETGDQDIFTASASGTTRLKLTNAGNLTFNQASTIGTAGSANLTLDAGGNLVLADTTVQLSGGSSTLDVYNASADTTLTVSNSSASVANLSVEGQVLPGSYTVNPTQIGNGAIIYRSDQTQLYYYNGSAWTAIGSGSGGGGLWRIISGALSPLNDTLDVLIGNSASASAKFAFLNVGSGTPTASISGNLALAVPTGATPANLLNLYNGGSLNIQTSPGGDAGLTSRLFVDKAGQVGIGTTSPSAPLHIQGAITGEQLRLDDISATGNPYISFYQTGTRRAFLQSNDTNDTVILASEYGDLAFKTASLAGSDSDTEYMRIKAGGLVGIGTTAPISRLQVTNNPSTLTGKAALIVDQYENQDLITASASGTTRFYVSNSGDMVAQRFADLANTTYLVDPAATGNAAVNIAGGVTTGTGILTSTVANGATAVGFTLNTSNTLSTQGSKLLSLQNNTSEKFYVDSSGNLYVAGTVTSSKGLSTLLTNKSGAQVAVGDLVVVDTTTASSFTTTTVAHNKKTFGVIVGIGLGVTNDADGDGVCDANDICLVATQGKVTVTGSNTTVIGDYLYSSTTAGKALASSVQSDGLIGIAMSADASDPYSVEMMFVVQPSGGGGGFFSNSNASVADGSYVEVAHNQATNDLNTTGWQYNTATSLYEQIDVGAGEQATASATVNFNTEGNYTQENMAYAVTLTPSATSGDITLTLGSGTWNSDARVQQYCRVTGNSGVATLTAAPAAQTTITATTTTAFANTNAIASGSWYLYCTSYTGSVAKLNETNFGSGADGAITVTTTKNLNTNTIASGRTYADGIAYRVTAPADGATSVTRYSGSDTISNGIAANDEVLLVNLQGASGDTADVGNYEFMRVSSVTASTITFSTAITKSFDGTTASNQKVVIQRVPQYTNVTLSGSGSLTASAWDALATTPTGAAGYLTGIVALRAAGTVTVGSGTSITVNALGYQGGAGGPAPNLQNGYNGVGINGVTTQGGAATTGGGAGGISSGCYQGGGGGSYGTSGTNGLGSCGGASAGTTHGAATLSTVFLGSGGGGGASYGDGTGSGNGGAGARAGGIVFVSASTVTVSGGISANGATGSNGVTHGHGGGGGAGGSILIAGLNITAGSSLITATGGNGGSGYLGNNGGSGGSGRIRVEYTGTLSGTTSPSASTQNSISSNIGISVPITTVYSVVTAGDQISTSSWGDIDDVDVTETLNSQTIYYSVSFDGRTTFAMYDSTANNNGWRPIARNNSGTWQYNSNTTAGVSNVTWTSATYNSQNGALSQAYGVTTNQMSGTTLGALTDGNWNEINGYTSTTATLDFSAGFKSSSSTQNPQVDQITVDYTKAGFKIIQTDTNTARLYNYSGVTKNLRLDVTTNGGAVHSGLYTNANSSLANGSYVEVAHNQNTNNLLANGWIYQNSVWKDVATATESGIISATNASVADGSYVELVHNQNTNGLLSKGWKYNSSTSQWEEIDNGSAGTGGTITYSGGYTIHTFTSSGTFIPPGSGNVEYLVVGGGGGGGGDYYAGGGGAGGFRTATGFAVTAQAYTITIGAGGAGASSAANGTVGGDSVFSTITSSGGGYGSGTGGVGGAGGNGGSGGGGSAASGGGGTGTGGQGTNGGAANASQAGGSGGGATGAGVTGTNSDGADGGAGTASSISGSSVTYAGGGGGGVGFVDTLGIGGSGGGGNGGGNTIPATNGTANRGGGGGGAGYGGGSTALKTGGNGGSGIVIIRYQTDSISPAFKTVQQDANTIRLYNYSGATQNLRLDVSTQAFQIRQIDTNTVRLYNYSGSTQNLRLDAIVGGVDSPSNGTVTLAPTSADVDSQSSTNSIWVNKTGLDGTLLKLQKSGTDILNLSQAGGNAALVLDQRLGGDILTASASGSTKFTIANTGAVTSGVNDATTNAITDIVTLDHTTSGTAANNIGTGLLFRSEDSAGNTENAGRISGILANATDTSEQSAITFDTRGINYVSDVGTFSTTSQGQLPATQTVISTITASIGGTQYIYVTGGSTPASTVYKATINSSGNVGTFATTSQGQLLQALYGHNATTTSIGGTQYMYVIGGYNGGTKSTVYKATIDSSGNVSTFATTSQGQLPQGLYIPNTTIASIGGTQYIYVTGGDNNGAGNTVSTVYKATIDSSGNIGTFATTTQGQLPQTLYGHGAVTASIGGTQYIYVTGGSSGTDQSTVYKATIDSSGNIGTFATTSQSQLPATRGRTVVTVTASIGGTQYVYVMGGAGPVSTVYKATIDSSGNIGTFATTSQGQLPQALTDHSAVTASIGGTQYMYVAAGGTPSGVSTVYKATIGPDTGTTTLTRRMKLDHVGNLTISGTITQSGSPDIAENVRVSDTSIEGGDVVAVDVIASDSEAISQNKGIASPSERSRDDIYNRFVAKKADQPYAKTILGVISSDPGIVLNASKNVVNDDKKSQENERPLVLAGRVPVKIDPDSEPIEIGDPLTASSRPGYAMKATKAGYVVAKALESWQPCSSVIPDPTPSRGQALIGDPDYNTLDSRVRGNDNCGTDRILVFVQYGYQTGDLSPSEFFSFESPSFALGFGGQGTKKSALADSLGLEIESPRPDNLFNNSTSSADLSSPSTDSGLNGRREGDSHSIPPFGETQGLSSLAPTLGVSPPPFTSIASATEWLKENWDSLSKTNTDLIQSLWVKTGVLTADFIDVGNLTIGGKPIADYISDEVQKRLNPAGRGLTFTHQFDVLSPIASDSAGIAVQLGDRQTFGIYNKEGSPAAVFDSVGNATLLGELSAGKIVIPGLTRDPANNTLDSRVRGNDILLDVRGSASIAGTLYADRIVTRFGDLDDRLHTMEASVSGSLPLGDLRTLSDLHVEKDATSSALLALLSQNKLGPLDQSVPLDSLKVTTNLSVLGSTTLGSTSVAGSLLVDGSLSLSAYGINTIGETLYLQKQKFADLDLMDGALVVNTMGNVMIKGDLTVGGTLFTNTISPIGEGDLVLNLSHETNMTNGSYATPSVGFGRFVIRGAGGLAVATIDASGSARFSGDVVASGSGIFSKLVIATSNVASQSANVADTSSNATIGKATLPAGTTEVDVFTTKVSENSYIYITPISSTNNRVLYLKSKTSGTGFQVAIDQPLPQDVQFNWWVIN